MNTEQNKAVVRRFFAEFNKHDTSAYGEIFAPEYILDFPGGPGTTHGLKQFLAASADFLATFPDLCFTLDNVIAEGEYVAVGWTMRATHGGPLGPIPASGKPIVLSGNSLIQLVDGKIVADHVRADMLGVLGQIGVLSQPEPVGL